jgi:hypothetical protein
VSTYKPKGKIIPLLEAIEADRLRVFSVAEAAALMKVPRCAVMAMVAYAIRAGLIFRGKDVAGRAVLRGTAFPAGQAAVLPPFTEAICKPRRKAPGWRPDEDDVRIARVVPGWTPPKMVPPRGQR